MSEPRYPAVVEADALDWLREQGQGAWALVTSPPDASEIGLDGPAYAAWLQHVLDLIFTMANGPVVLVLTDRKQGGAWHDKTRRAMESATAHSRSLLWHRIALRRQVGGIDLHVPTYSHVLAFGPGTPGKARPDVIDQGKRWWAHGVGWDLALFVAGWLQEQGVMAVMDPFAGSGAFLVAAQEHGLAVKGCELHPGRAEAANRMLEEAEQRNAILRQEHTPRPVAP